MSEPTFRPAFQIGIDLGTTHTVLAYSPATSESGRAPAPPEVFPILQLVAAGEVRALPLLPSFVYLPGAHELPKGATALPWGDPGYAVGAFARDQGSRVSGRLVASAKSWLCNAGVDRTGAILPWGAPAEVERISPVDASGRTLDHLRRAWNHTHPQAPLEEQDLVLTVPASFDEVARELTVRAAQQAGLPRFVLLEEPQAAFYDWLSFAGRGGGADSQALDAALGETRHILIVDVGGGTTDLTLIDCGERGRRKITRVAVGEHLMLGGDNMDLALAHRLEPKLGGARLDAGQWSMLVQSARGAKELLLAAEPKPTAKVTVVGRGSRLIGGSLSAEVARDEVEAQLLDGFFPRIPADAELLGQPGAQRPNAANAIQELGLPFASDPAITRQILSFLRKHAGDSPAAPARALPRPDAILLNGGVFNAPAIRTHLLQAVSAWWPGAPAIPLLKELPGRTGSLDLAVARGAAWFARVRQGEGTRIGGGSARSCFVTVDAPTGEPVGLCVVARGQEEGPEVPLPGRLFSLALGTPVRFSLSSSTTALSKVGELTPLADAEPLPPIETVLSGQGRQGRTEVRLVSRLTEIGTLEIFCEEDRASAKGPGNGLRWKLEFSLRGAAARDALATQVEPLPRRFEEGREWVDRVYGKRPQPVSPRDVKDLFRNLEKVLGPRESWSSATCRELWSAAHAGTPRRRRSADHERIWCQLAGYSLRPGFGHPLDAWRVSETWKAFEGGLQFHTGKSNWNEWWILWRRVAAGLDAAAHQTIWNAILPHLRPIDPAAKPVRFKGIKPEGTDEMLRLAASLERVPTAQKVELGAILLERLRSGAGGTLAGWCLGRLGARQPVASAHTAIDPELASSWLTELLALDWKAIDGAPFAALQLCRKTGDRSRDIDPALAEAVALRLVAAGAPEGWSKAVRELTQLSGSEQARVFGESLPTGLRLID